jgi:hypothetical protein
MERKYKSQGRQLLEDLSGITIGGKLAKELAKKAGRKRTDPEAVRLNKLGTKRKKSIRKTAAKAPSTKMDKERTMRMDLRQFDKDIKGKSFSQLMEEMDKTEKQVKARKEKLKKFKAGGKVKGYKKGGPITYRMAGGQVVDNSYD